MNSKIINNGSACGIKTEKAEVNIEKSKNMSKKHIVISFLGRLHARKGIVVLKKILDHFKNSDEIKFHFFAFSFQMRPGSLPGVIWDYFKNISVTRRALLRCSKE